MGRPRKYMESTTKTSTAQKKAVETYRAKPKNKTAYAKYQRENFKNIGASYKRPEAIYIADIFEKNGIKPAEILRGAAAALRDGQTIRTEREPLTVPPEYADNLNREEDPQESEK